MSNMNLNFIDVQYNGLVNAQLLCLLCLIFIRQEESVMTNSFSYGMLVRLKSNQKEVRPISHGRNNLIIIKNCCCYRSKTYFHRQVTLWHLINRNIFIVCTISSAHSQK